MHGRFSLSIAETLGGVIAGDPRRYCELSFELAVAVPAHNPAPVLDAFEAHPSVIVVVERGERRAVGVTVEGVPVRLAVAEPARFGTELLRSTGPPAYVAALEPLPDRPDEESRLRGARPSVAAARAPRPSARR